MINGSPMKCRQRPDITIIIDWDVKPQTLSASQKRIIIAHLSDLEESIVIAKLYTSRLMGKPTIYICENKDVDQLRGIREADQRLSFRYTDSTVPLLLKSECSSFWPAFVIV